MGRRRNPGRREEDAAHGKQGNWAKIEPELAPAHRYRRRVDDGRQDQKQHHLGSELHSRQAGDEGENYPGQHQKNGRRNLEPGCEDRNCGNHAQQQDQNLDGRNHARPLPMMMAKCQPKSIHPAARPEALRD